MASKALMRDIITKSWCITWRCKRRHAEGKMIGIYDGFGTAARYLSLFYLSLQLASTQQPPCHPNKKNDSKDAKDDAYSDGCTVATV